MSSIIKLIRITALIFANTQPDGVSIAFKMPQESNVTRARETEKNTHLALPPTPLHPPLALVHGARSTVANARPVPSRHQNCSIKVMLPNEEDEEGPGVHLQLSHNSTSRISAPTIRASSSGQRITAGAGFEVGSAVTGGMRGGIACGKRSTGRGKNQMRLGITTKKDDTHTRTRRQQDASPTLVNLLKTTVAIGLLRWSRVLSRGLAKAGGSGNRSRDRGPCQGGGRRDFVGLKVVLVLARTLAMAKSIGKPHQASDVHHVPGIYVATQYLLKTPLKVVKCTIDPLDIDDNFNGLRLTTSSSGEKFQCVRIGYVVETKGPFRGDSHQRMDERRVKLRI
ncbi:hypothetical protein EDB19DRAFT_2026254 [Suillus lakei]|nr:hypothetical protein EDB19DRAFT_2026254 [Suillus lakei]